LYRARRIDDNCEQDWGQDIGFVANVDGSVMLEELIQKTLLTSSCDDPAKTSYGDRVLTREDIEVTPLGVASSDLPLGILLKSNAGS
jgi:hypothetical protein